MVSAIEIFLCYAREDEALLKELEKHLAPLKRQGLIDLWHDRYILPGAERELEIRTHLDTAHIILLFISPRFLASDYSHGKEMVRAMERHQKGEARVIPIRLRPVDFQNTPFSKFPALPKDDKPITKWSNYDDAWDKVAAGIKKIIEGMQHNLLKEYLGRVVANYGERMNEAICRPAAATYPYKYLDSFEIKDASIFFGRDTAINDLSDKVKLHRLTVLHARSGAGKTSLLRAGLFPHLFKEHWLPLYVRISGERDPIQAVKQAIAPDYGSWPALLTSLSLHAFLRMVCDLLSQQTKALVIMLDQFEEFFRFSPDMENRSAFIKDLEICYRDEALPIRWLISLRGEQFSNLAEFQQTAPSLQIFQSQYLLNVLTREEALLAITRPIAQLDLPVRYDEDLLETVLDDLACNNMMLPLLQILCTQLYELYRQRTSTYDRLTIEMYATVGRAGGVLQYYLDGVFARLSAQEQTLAKTVLKAFVSSDGMNRYMSDRALTTHTGVHQKDLEGILHHLIAARLLYRDRDDEIEGKYRYELAHEYLITTIRNWIEPADWEFKQIKELLQREVASWHDYHSPIPKERLEILFRYRSRFTRLGVETWACLLHSALVIDFAVADWVKTIGEDDSSVLFKEIIAWLIAAFRDENEDVGRRSAEALGQLQDARAVEPLIAALQDEKGHVKRLAIQALGQLKDVRVVEPLIAMLSDKDKDVRWQAAEALGQLKDVRVVEPLIAMLSDKDKDVRWRAAEALGQLKDVRAVEPLIAILRDESEDVRWQAAKALGQLKDVRAIEPLVAMLQDEKDHMRLCAAWALGQLQDARAVEPLIAALRDENVAMRVEAAEALGQLKDARAVEPLIAALRDENEDKYVRLCAAQVLGQLKNVRAIEPLIAALQDENVAMHAEAAWALGQLQDARAVEPLIAMFSDEDVHVRWQVAEALGQLKDVRAIEPLIAALQDENEGVRWQVAEALGRLKDVRAIEPLVAALQDENEHVRLCVTQVLGQLKDVRAIEPLIAMLRNENVAMRVEAAEALGQLKDVRAIEPLIAALQDENEGMRWRAAEALGQLKDARTVELLIAMLRDRDKDVRWRAARVLNNRESLSTQEASKENSYEPEVYPTTPKRGTT